MNWKDKIRDPNCTLCPLHEGAEHVCLMGSGKRSAKIMIVGEAPGEREDAEHAAFVGPAGQLLTQLLEEVGIKRDECYITNAVKCRPLDNATPTRSQAATCQLAYGGKEVGYVQPDWILSLGNTALQALTRRSGITKHRGKPLSYEGIPVFPTFHPAAALRSASYLPAIQADFKNFARRIGRPQTARGDELQRKTRTRLITNRAGVRALVRRLEASSTIAFDLETTGLHEWEDGAKVVTIGVSWAPGEAAVVPLHHSWNSEKSPPPDFVIRSLKAVLEDRRKKFVAHNGKFDCKWLAKEGIFMSLHFDTMIAAHLLDENRPKGLKYLAQLLLEADDYDIEVKDCFNHNLKKLAIYNGKDCDYTLRLYHIFKQQLKEEPRVARLFKFLMMPASDVFTRIEAGGIWVDPRRLSAATVQAEEVIRRLERFMGAGINYNSPKQVAEWLFGELKLPVIERTKGDAPSTAESSLLRLADKDRRVQALLKYRKWSKYLSTYLRPFGERRDSKSRIHPSYRFTGTVTGRISAAEPNLQQVPRDPLIRRIIGAPDGWRFVEADYSQIELRVAAMLAHEKNMLRAFKEGVDIHLKTAVETTGKRPEDITKEERKRAKAINFGFLYGMGAAKFVIYARDNYEVEVTLKEAEEVRDGFFSSYPNLRSWHARQRRLAARYQRVQSPVGRIRHLPDVLNTREDVRAEAERQAINSPVQALASDLCLVSAVRLGQTLPYNVARITGSVHDSLLLEVRDESVEEVVPFIRATMEDVAYLKRTFGAIITVPIVVEIEVGKHWSEGTVVPRAN